MKIYQDAKDKNVAAVILYKGTNEDEYFYDVKKTQPVDLVDGLSLFANGAVVLETNMIKRPVAVEVDEETREDEEGNSYEVEVYKFVFASTTEDQQS